MTVALIFLLLGGAIAVFAASRLGLLRVPAQAAPEYDESALERRERRLVETPASRAASAGLWAALAPTPILRSARPIITAPNTTGAVPSMPAPWEDARSEPLFKPPAGPTRFDSIARSAAPPSGPTTHDRGDEWSAPGPTRLDVAGPTRPLLTVEIRAHRLVREHVLGPGEHLVGRLAGCPVQIDHPNVSRSHALLVVDEHGAVVRPLGPTNGVRLNGTNLRAQRRLQAGDRVRFADNVEMDVIATPGRP